MEPVTAGCRKLQEKMESRCLQMIVTPAFILILPLSAPSVVLRSGLGNRNKEGSDLNTTPFRADSDSVSQSQSVVGGGKTPPSLQDFG